MKKNLFKNIKLSVSKDTNKIKRLPLIKYAYLSLIISTTTIIFTLAILPKLPPEIPLYYGQPEGEAQLAGNAFIILPCAIGIAITIFNVLAAYFIENTLLKKIIIITALAYSITSTITTIKIAFLVGNIF